MYKINLSQDGQYYATFQSRNGEVLNTTETVEQHRSAVKNIHSTMKAHGSSKPQKVIDFGLQRSYVLRLEDGKVKKFNDKPLPRNAYGKKKK